MIVCTDAGLSSKTNRKYNDLTLGGVPIRSFITTQSVKQLPKDLKDYALDPKGWHLIGHDESFDISGLDEDRYYDCIFYKDKWIKEDISAKKQRKGAKPLEQHLIVSFSIKYRNYQRKIRQGQIDRAQELINSGRYKQRGKNQNDPHRFIGRETMTADGEACEKEVPYLDMSAIADEEQYDGFYAVCTNLDDVSVDEIIKINKGRWEIEECFRIRGMMMYRPGEKQGYLPAYTRTDLTDTLHETFGFRTDYEILTDISMKRVIRETKKK